eukprot:scaffold1127_cov160-Amphora_coffeaeformis.AAC.1
MATKKKAAACTDVRNATGFWRQEVARNWLINEYGGTTTKRRFEYTDSLSMNETERHMHETYPLPAN